MGKYKTYEKYKPSGVEWLEAIPKDWGVAPLKRYSDYIQRGLSPIYVEDESVGLPVINQACIYWDGLKLENAKFLDPSKLTGERGRLHFGDLLVNSTGTGTLGRIGLFTLEQEYFADSHITIVRTNSKLLERFLYYILQSEIYQGYIYSVLSAGATNQIELSRWGLANTPILVPSLDEQKSITRFLDRETIRIDTLISKKRQLIDLLRKKRDAIVAKAITQGLEPNSTMKDSQIEWLGQIPSHWKTPSLCYICDLAAGGTPDRSNLDYWNGEIPWVKTGEINYNRIEETEEYITELGLINSSAKIAPPGTLLMAMYGQGVTRGRVAILDINAAFNQACLAINPHHLIDVRYLYYYFVNAYSYIRDFGNLTSQMNLSLGYIAKLKVLLPSIEEQKKIVSFLDEIAKDADDIVEKLYESIKKLEKYRSALITAAVTGKIDVRQEIS